MNSVEDHSFRRTVPIDPDRLNSHLERVSYRAWAEDQDNEDPWNQR